MHAINGGRHVRAFRHKVDSVLQEIVRVLRVDFVLGRARKRALRLMIPKRIVIELGIGRRVDCALELVLVLGHPAAANVFQVHDKGEFLVRDSRLVVNVAGRIGQSDRARS